MSALVAMTSFSASGCNVASSEDAVALAQCDEGILTQQHYADGEIDAVAGATAPAVKSGRTKYDGVLHLIFKNLWAENVNFFTAVELSTMMNEFDQYQRYIKEFNSLQKRNDQRRVYDLMVANTSLDVQHHIVATVGVDLLDSIKSFSIVPLSVDTLMERKRSMCRNIALIFAAKAKKIVCNHRGFKSTFRYTAADSTQIDTYFIQRMLAEFDYLKLYHIIRTLHIRAIAIQMEKRRRREEREEYEKYLLEQEEEREEERFYRARNGFMYDDGEHEAELSQNSYRNNWYSGHSRGYRSDSD